MATNAGLRQNEAARARAFGWTTLAYGGLGAVGAIATLVDGRDPLTMPAWLAVDGWGASCLSIGLGVGIAVMTIAATRTMVAHAAWARQLHGDLRPVVHGAGDGALFVSAILSGVAEEIFFRGLLVPMVGAIAPAVAFGLLHQVRGRARWAWAAWAAIMGLVFAGIFQVTGHLEGAIVAHVLINTANLRFLRDGNPLPKPRAIGGLL